ncbi:PLP-dependent aminotransferase family protein [Pseudonocardia sp. KRD-291]|nr:PLP-dependent aminotransferase family protein [Pseudonocardia sp. KRD291]
MLERRIIGNTLGPGGRLPSTRTLAVELGVSRSTVQVALDMLVAEGYVESRPRSGLFAARGVRGRLAAPRDDQETGRWWQARLAAPGPETDRVAPSWWNARYPFVTGQIDSTLFPQHTWLRALRRSHDAGHVEWSSSEHGGDDPLLVEQICAQLLPARGIDVDPRQVVVTLGSQQALAVLADLLVRPGDRVVIEEPGYPDARAIMRAAGAELVVAPVDADGIDLTGVTTRGDLVYVTPSHQHPTNVTMSLERRLTLLDAAARWDSVIVEDDYDSELRYEGAPSPALASLDHGRRTVYLGTFSKFLSPGLRLGFLVGPPELADAVRDRIRLTVRQVPSLLQRAMALFIQSGDYARALARHRRELRTRWTAARSAAVEHLPCVPEFPPGGGSLWLRTTDGTDWRDVLEPARRRGILLQNPAHHWAHPTPSLSCLRLGFTALSADRITPGIAELGVVHREARLRRQR